VTKGRPDPARTRAAARRAKGTSITMTTPLVTSHNAGSQKLCGVPSRHEISRALENTFTVQEIVIRIAA